MDKILKAIDMFYLDVTGRMKRALESEKGDTNFISIMIILGIVLLVAIVFITFKNEIMKTVTTTMNNFLSSFT